MKLYPLFMSLLLIFIASCSDSKTSIKISDGEALLTYFISNSYGWTSIDSISKEGAGECKIKSGNIIYIKTDTNFSGGDFCTWVGDDPSSSGCVERYYYIDFSDSSPQLSASGACS